MDSSSFDEATVSKVATLVSRALNQPTTNRVFARRVIDCGLRSHNLSDFHEKVKEYGNFSADFASQIYSTVAAKMNASSGAGEAFERAAPEPEPAPKAEEEQKWGLNVRHVYNPTAQPKGKSVLGLDVLAKKKREEQQAKNRIAVSLQLEDEEAPPETSNFPTPSMGGSRAGGRQFRGARMETPSYTGGVNESALEAIQERKGHGGQRGVFVGRTGGDERGGDRDREGGGDRRRTRDEWEETPQRGYDSRMATPSRETSGRGGYERDTPGASRHAWDMDTPSVPTARSGAGAGAASSRMGSTRPTPAPGSRPVTARRHQKGKRPMFDIDLPAGGASSARTGTAGGASAARGPPRAGGGAVGDDDVKLTDEEIRQIEAEQAAEQGNIDRAWYDDEEGGGHGEAFNPFAGDDASYRKKEVELQKRLTRRDGSLMTLAQSKKASQLQADNNAWEENRILTSGAGRLREVNLDFDDEEEARITLLVHDTRPPFLDGKTVFTKQMEPVLPVKDVTCDMAKIARAGSALVKEVRQKREGDKSRERFWELGGTAMGNAIGVKKEEKAEDGDDKAALVNADGEVDFKESAGFAKHMSSKSAAQSNFSQTKSIAEQRRFLPVFGVREDLMDVIRENNVIVVVGETGSGKTTQLTQYMMEEGYSNFGMIGCTQPRRVAAMSVAKRVSEEVGCPLGDKVGYAIRFEDVTSKETLIKYMTEGVLLRETLRETELDSYSCIIMDEAHERSVNTDVLFGILKKVVARRRDFRLVVTSATLNAEKFSNFFGSVPIFKIPGRTFPVEEVWAKSPVEDYVDGAVKQALAIHLGQPAGDVLIFLTGQEEIEACCFALADRLKQIETAGAVAPMLILPMYSLLNAEQQALIFQPAPEGTRKCIVSTNIAETSVTLDGILYVIDSGMCKMNVFNPRMGMDQLQVWPCSRAGVDQRKGRAGRTASGWCYRLFTEAAYKYEMLANNVPEIQRTNLSSVVLLLKSLRVDNLLEFDFMDPPPQENILNSMYQLWILGALSNTGDLTPTGSKMVEFPLDPPLAKMLLTAETMGCSDEILTIVAMLSAGSPFFRPKEREEQADSAKEKFFVPESDHLTLLNVYIQWKNNGCRGDWCSTHFLHHKTIQRARDIRGQLMDTMKQQRIALTRAGQDWDVSRKAICAAYFQNAARLKGIGEYVNCRSSMPCHLHPSSALYGLGYTPDYVVYHELVMTSKEYMQCVTAVEPQWLAELGPMFFTLQESGARAESRKKMKLEKEAMEKEMRAALDAKVAAAKAEEERRKQVASVQRSAIATPGRARDGATPQRTPRRFGL